MTNMEGIMISVPNTTGGTGPQKYPLASKDVHERVAALAEKLGFEEVRIFARNYGVDPLIHARWRGAPVALSLRTGIPGGFSVAFYAGPQPSQTDEDGYEYPGDEWEEVADTHVPSEEVTLVLGAALLEEFGEPAPHVGKQMP